MPTPPPTPPPTPSPTPTPTPTPTPGKQDVYVVLRMDDTNQDDMVQEQVDALNWAIDNRIAMTFGVITSVWPEDCLANPGGKNCNSASVKAFNKAYNDDLIVGTHKDAFIEIADHSWGHETWATQWQSKSWVASDFVKSAPHLQRAFPKASLRTFIAPECLANAGTLDVMLEHKYDIMSAEGQMSCEGPEYWYAPCTENGDNHGDCIPPGDVYFTTHGMNKMANGIISLPTGSANSHMALEEHGRSVDITIGVDDCGCHGDDRCPLIPNARANSLKSHGLWWTVLMMHPQTSFKTCCGQTYKQWLEEFLPAIRALKDYNVHFVTFQDLAAMTAPSKKLWQAANASLVV